ncbi:MAG: hypothetical protein NTV52_32455 [Acidobacteria bacterium]|nr:hypothetical protein [Acidobacteriota bacterium]
MAAVQSSPLTPLGLELPPPHGRRRASLLVTLLPGVLAHSYPAYLAAYGLLMLAATAALFALTESFALHRNRDVQSTLNWLTAFLTPLAGLVLWRFDILVAVTALGVLLLLARARPGTAGVVAAVGALIKLVPALLLALPVLRFRLEPRPALRSVATFAITVALVSAGWFAYAALSLNASFGVHSNRGLEFGSLAAGLLLLLGQLWPLSARLDGSGPCLCLEVRHAWAPALAAVALPIQAFALALSSLWIALRRHRDDARDAALLLLAYVVAGKVLSPQYLIWLAPLVAFLPRLRWPFLAACMLTTIVYPLGFELLLNQVAWPIVALNVRNAILVYCVWLIVSPTSTRVD